MITLATLTASLLLGLHLVRRDLVRAAADEPPPPLQRLWLPRALLFAIVVVLLAPRLWELVT